MDERMPDELFEIRSMELSRGDPAFAHADFAMDWYKSIIDSGALVNTHVEICADAEMRTFIAETIAVAAQWAVEKGSGTERFENHMLALRAILRDGMFGYLLYGAGEFLFRTLESAVNKDSDDDVLMLWSSLLGSVCREMRHLIDETQAAGGFKGVKLRVERE